MNPFIALLYAVAVTAALLPIDFDYCLPKLKKCLSVEEVFSVYAFLQSLPNLKVHLPEEYYSPQGLKSLDIFHAAKITASKLATLIGNKCTAVLSEVDIATCKCHILAGATMLNGYRHFSDNLRFDRQLFGPKAAQYPRLRKNVLEELEIMMNYYAFVKVIGQPGHIGVSTFIYVLARVRLLILVNNNNIDRLVIQSYLMLPPTSDGNIAIHKSLMKKPIAVKPLESISQARELKIMQQHFRVVRTDYCCHVYYSTRQKQLSEAYSKMRTKHPFIDVLVRKEITLNHLPDVFPTAQLSVDCFASIAELNTVFSTILELPEFFKLILSNEEYGYISGMFMRDDLLLVEHLMFPKLPIPSSNETSIKIARELLTSEKFDLVYDWHRYVTLKLFEIGCVPYIKLDEVEESLRPIVSLYSFAKFLIKFMEHYKSPYTANFVRVSLRIVERLFKYVKDEAWLVRLQMLHESASTLLATIQRQ